MKTNPRNQITTMPAAARARGGEFRGFTLIEILMTLVIIGLVASVVMARVGSASRAAELRSAIAAWQDLDHRARLFAQREGAVVLTVSSDGRTLTAMLEDGDQGAAMPPLSATLPAFVRGELRTGQVTQTVRIGARGRSEDYSVRVHDWDDGTEVAWSVGGLLGWVEVNDR